MRRFLRDNGLTLTMLALFLIFLASQSVTGYRVYNQDQTEHGEETVSYGDYLTTGHFVEATFENWESEFFQMAAYVFMTVFLFQRGSSESKDPDKPEAVDEDPRSKADDPNAPWPVKRGGVILSIYKNSLSLAFLLLFVVALVLHARGGAREYSEEQLAHGGQPVSTVEFAETAEFWFQSFQNWQSEFLAVAAIAFLSIYLRQEGSPESKPVAAPHSQTGE